MPIKKAMNPTYMGFLLIANVPPVINALFEFSSMPTLNDFPNIANVTANHTRLIVQITIDTISIIKISKNGLIMISGYGRFKTDAMGP